MKHKRQSQQKALKKTFHYIVNDLFLLDFYIIF